MEPDRPLVGAPSGDTPPKRVFGYFLHEQKVPRRRLWNGLIPPSVRLPADSSPLIRLAAPDTFPLGERF